MEGLYHTLERQRLLNRPAGCIHKRAWPLLCDKRGCPIHDPRVTLTKTTGTGKSRCPRASAAPGPRPRQIHNDPARAKVGVENDGSSILKRSRKITEPAVAVERAESRSPSKSVPVTPNSVKPTEESATLSSSSSATTPSSSSARGSSSSAPRRSPRQYGDPGVAVPKGVKKRRIAAKARGKSFKQRVARLFKD
ncbi:hypothetical protein DL546_009278 [Coniochaeta pulveracea]|uniref:Uncharacterized protein n=1 Tax=Coniochaeta pulveracea TaxID=177199 RepID=A0A420YII8_9PEZI|nr:hypothetical protein DL546_009278 [Coniochaeta pulveracea]